MKKTLSINTDAFFKPVKTDVRQIIVHDRSTVAVEIPVRRGKKYTPTMEAALKAVAGMQ